MLASDLTPLPSPTDRPTADVVVYDGQCRFCTDSARKLARADRAGRLSFLSLHDPEVPRRWPELSREELVQYLYIVTPAGTRYRGAEAMKHLSTKLPSLYWMSPFLHIPGTMPLWQRVYRAFARRRYRFGRIDSCEDGSCRTHGSS